MVTVETKVKVLFECDREKCKECSPECHLTSDITHAQNFDIDYCDNETMVFIERRNKNEK